MTLPSFSIRTNVLSLIVLMGFWAFVLAMVTLYLSTKYILENENESYGNLVETHTSKLLEELNSNSVNLAIKTQQQPTFKKAFKSNDLKLLSKLLNDQFQQYYYTAGIVDIKKMIILDTNLEYLAQAEAGLDSPINEKKSLQPILESAMQRKGADRIKPLTALFIDNDTPFHLSLTAIGGLRVNGYMLVISNPVLALDQLDDQLGQPVSIYDSKNTLRYQSHQSTDLEGLTRFQYPYFTEGDQLAFKLEIHRDITSLSEQMETFVVYVAMLALLITFIIVIGAIAFFNKSLITPLEKVSSHMGRIAHAKSSLEEIDSMDGNKEIHNLVNSFNLMSSHINELNTELQGLAYRDELTHIPNRRAFGERLQELTHLARKNDQGFCIMMIDLNKFKEVNDQYGHDAGDQLLQFVASKISHSIRATDMLARLGGDEFGIVLPGMLSKEHVERVSKQIISNACQETQINDVKLKPALSIGFAFYTQESANIEEVINEADRSMYKAKHSGAGYSH